MRANIIFFILLSFYCLPSFAQPLLITCSSERNQDNSISIYADSKAQGEYTVKLIFTSLEGYTSVLPVFSNIALVTVAPGRREIMKLSQNKLAFSFSFQYRYQYFPGKALRKAPDSAFVYLLPANAGNSLRISQVTSLSEKLGQIRTNDYRGTGFVYKPGDTICAARTGTVYSCNDAVKQGEKTDEFL